MNDNERVYIVDEPVKPGALVIEYEATGIRGSWHRKVTEKHKTLGFAISDATPIGSGQYRVAVLVRIVASEPGYAMKILDRELFHALQGFYNGSLSEQTKVEYFRAEPPNGIYTVQSLWHGRQMRFSVAVNRFVVNGEIKRFGYCDELDTLYTDKQEPPMIDR